MRYKPEWSNPIVSSVLQASGWTPDRSVNVDPWIQALDAEGYAVTEDWKQLLVSFGQLRLIPVLSASARFRSGELFFDPLWAASGERARIVRREQQLGCKLIPLGEWIGEYIVLLADDGRVFAETTGQVLLLGDSFAEALETIITGDRAIRDMTPRN